MPDSVERIEVDLIGRDRSMGRTLDEASRKADKAGKSFDDLGKDSRSLEKHIGETEAHLKSLIEEFDRTGDKTLFRDVRKDKSLLSLLKAMRKEIETPAKQSFISNLLSGAGDLLSEHKLVTGLAGAAAIASPLIGSAIGAAVLGTVGGGGIIGGIALAAQDSRVQTAGSALGEHLLGGLKDAAKPFVGPLLAEFGTLTRAGDEFTGELGDGFKKLAPLVRPLAKGIEGLVHEIGPGLSAAFSAAQPVIRAVANELPEVGAALSDMLSAIAEEGDGATEGLITLLHVTEFLARATGEFVGWLSYEYDWLVKVGAAADDVLNHLGPLSAVVGGIGNVFADEATKIETGLDDATSSNHDFYLSMLDTKSATDEARASLVKYAQGIQDQFDPTDNLIHRLQDVRDRQKEYNQAVKDHGPHSQAAKDANLKLAEAVLAASGAAATASGTFNGELTPALHDILVKGGMTEDQIRDIGKQFRDAMHKGEDFAQTYKAQAIVEAFYEYRAGERNPSGKASGGPVLSGQTYLVGENGPEIVTMGGNGYVHNAASTRSMLSGASGGSAGPAMGGVVDVQVSVAPSAASRDLMSQLILEMLRVDAGFRSTVAGYVGAST
jgi:hypothetical protein